MKRNARRDSPAHKKYRRNYSPDGRSEHPLYIGNEQSRYRGARAAQYTDRRVQRNLESLFPRPGRDEFSSSSSRREQSSAFNLGQFSNRRSARRSYASSVSRPQTSTRIIDRYLSTGPDLQEFVERPGKIDPVFAAAAAAALNAGLVPSSTDFANLTGNVSRNMCTTNNANSSATVAAVAAAAMNAAALAAAFGSTNVNPAVFDRSSRYDSIEQFANYRNSSRRRSPANNRSYNYRKDVSDGNSIVRRYGEAPPRESDRQIDRSGTSRFPHHLDHKEPEDDPTATRTLFVGNLPPDVRESDLRETFERYGMLEDIDIKRPLPNSNSNAYAFLRFVNLNMAHQAKLNMSGKSIGQFTCKIGYGKVTPTRCLWIGGLGPWIKYPAFAALVERLATPEKIIWPSGKTYAHILFSSVETAQSVASTLRGYPLGGNDRKIRVDYTDESHMRHDPLLSRRRIKPQAAIHRSLAPSRPRREVPRAYADERYREHRSRRQAPSDEGAEAPLRSRNRPASFSRSPSGGRSQSTGSFQGAKDSSVRKDRESSSSDRFRQSPPSDYGVRPGSVTPCGSESPGMATGRTPENSFLDTNEKISLETATSLNSLALCFPTTWKAVFVLKKSNFSCRMHIIRGDENLVDQFIPRIRAQSDSHGSPFVSTQQVRGPPRTPPEDCSGDERNHFPSDATRPERCDDSVNRSSDLHDSFSDGGGHHTSLRISQRMKMDPAKLEDVSHRMKIVGNQGFCVLLAMPTDEDSISESPSIRSGRPLRDLINYLATKDAAGVVLLNPLASSNSSQQLDSEEASVTGVLHVLPPCDFAYKLLSERAINLKKPSPNEKFLVILLIRSCGLL